MQEQQILANTECLLSGMHLSTVVYTATCPLEIGYPLIDQLIDTALGQKGYEKIAVLYASDCWAKQSEVIEKYDTHFICSRPKGSCAPNVSRKWKYYEDSNLRGLGRKELCPECSQYQSCTWAKQWSEEVPKAKIVAVNLAIFRNWSTILELIFNSSNEQKCLSIFETADIATFEYRKKIDRDELRDALDLMAGYCSEETSQNEDDSSIKNSIQEYAQLCEKILGLNGENIQNEALAPVELSSAALSRLQKYNMVENQQRPVPIPMYAVKEFLSSSARLRCIVGNGNPSYYWPPRLPGKTLILGPSIEPEAVKHILKQNIESLTNLLQPWPRSTSVYTNLAVLNTTEQFFTPEKRQVLDLFARYVWHEMNQGRKVLALVRSGDYRNEGDYVSICCRHLNNFFDKQNWPVRAFNAVERDGCGIEENIHPVPITTYAKACQEGAAGAYSNYESCVCLTSFNYSERQLVKLYNDAIEPHKQKTLQVDTCPSPRRRAMFEVNAEGEINPEPVATALLHQLEGAKALQAVSTIRSQTQPRNVFTSQCGVLPGVEYAEEYNGLAPFRAYLDEVVPLSLSEQELADKVLELRMQGWTIKDVAKELDVSYMRVKEHWDISEDRLAEYNTTAK